MNRQRAIVALLGAIAILLALNLVSEPEAQAQHGPPDILIAEPTVVAGETRVVGLGVRILRWWSDGTVDTSFVRFTGTESCDVFPTPFQCGPVVTIDPGL